MPQPRAEKGSLTPADALLSVVDTKYSRWSRSMFQRISTAPRVRSR